MTVTVLTGDVFDRLAELPDESVHCVVTSPPYFALRDYGVEGAIGLEPTFDEHLEVMVRVFHEVRRVLRKDGTLWLNYGDAYAGGGRGESKQKTNVGSLRDPSPMPRGLKPKDLMMMPARVALALQADGWWLRSEIVWHKPNPMPESTTDRPTSAHEKIYLLTKSARYFYDADAVRIPFTGGAHARRKDGEYKPAKGSDPNNRRTGTWKKRSVKMPDGWDTGPGAHDKFHRKGREKGKRAQPPRHEAQGPMHNGLAALDEVPKAEQQANGANLRNVWTAATEPFRGAHFAVMPTAIVEPCIKAGTSERGCCPECRAPVIRIVQRIDQGWDGSKYGERVVAATGGAINGGTAKSTLGSSNGKLVGQSETAGWKPTCECGVGGPIPCIVLDPFAGAGTVGLVADRLGRDAILIEINPDYAEMARNRIADDGGMFAEVAAE